MATLDNKSKALLEKDPSNPNGRSSSAVDAARPRPGLSSSVSAAAARKTLKDTIAAQKKRAAMANDIPPRPESAQSSFADTKPTRPAAHRTPAAKTTSSVRTVPTGTHLSSLSSAPMRPAMKPRRPELTRPATADPYADRRPPSAASHTKLMSPEISPAKVKPRLATTPGAKPSSPARPKSRLDAAPVSTAKSKPKRLDISTIKASDARTTSNHLRSNSSDLPQQNHPAEEDFTMAVPQVDGPEIDLISGEESSVPIEAIPVTYRVAEPVLPDMPAEATLPEKPRTAVRHARLSSDGSVSRLPVSNRRDSRASEESKAAGSPLLRSPNQRHSRNNTEGHSSMIPSPIAFRSIPPSEEVSNAESLKVYEDPEPPVSTEAVPSTIAIRSPHITFVSAKPVLEELPVNEPKMTPGHRDNKALSAPDSSSLNALAAGGTENTRHQWGKVEGAERRRSISPRSKDPVKAREMIDKGITRIRARALDVHGYRKLQGLIKYHDAIFTDETKYDEMLLALLDALEAPIEEKKSSLGRPVDLKTQILVTIRLMFTYNRTYFSAYYPRAMTALVSTRKQYELTNHIVSGLEETAEEIVAACPQPPDVIDAVLDLIETEEHDEKGLRAITFGIYVLNGLLQRLNKHRYYLSDPELERFGKFANKSLAQAHPDIRRAITEFCLELHEMVNNDEVFWRMINSPVSDHRHLLTYFIAKKKSSKGVRG
jgi:CLIP-associating protein 1/2